MKDESHWGDTVFGLFAGMALLIFSFFFGLAICFYFA